MWSHMGATPTTTQRGPGETFEVSLADCGPRASQTIAPTVTVRIDEHPTAAGRVSVRRDDVTWRFTLKHSGQLAPRKRIPGDGTPAAIVDVPGWLERVLWHIGFDAIEAA